MDSKNTSPHLCKMWIVMMIEKCLMVQGEVIAEKKGWFILSCLAAPETSFLLLEGGVAEVEEVKCPLAGYHPVTYTCTRLTLYCFSPH